MWEKWGNPAGQRPESFIDDALKCGDARNSSGNLQTDTRENTKRRGRGRERVRRNGGVDRRFGSYRSGW